MFLSSPRKLGKVQPPTNNLQGFFPRCSTVVPQAVEVAADVGDVTIFAANKNAASVAGQSMMGTDFKHGVPRISDQVEIPLGENSNGNMVKSINKSMYKMRKKS